MTQIHTHKKTKTKTKINKITVRMAQKWTWTNLRPIIFLWTRFTKFSSNELKKIYVRFDERLLTKHK